MYSIPSLGSMVADSSRSGAYSLALKRAITPGSVVLDIGCGTGFMSLLACKYGASRVYAIEPADAIVIAQDCARVNGYADRIQFFQALSTNVTLPERVDVMVSDLRGIMPLFNGHISSVIDARKRFLKPGGIQIAQADHLYAAPVECPTKYTSMVLGHHPNAFGLNLQPAQRYSSHNPRKISLKAEELLAARQCWGVLDYTRIESDDCEGSPSWTVERDGVCHGIVVWFDVALMEGVTFSNAPGLPETVYCQQFLPWPEPVPVHAGDTIKATISANKVQQNYVWRWDSRVFGGQRPEQMIAASKQSDFLGRPHLPSQLRKRTPAYVPKLTEDAQIERQILMLMDGRNTVQQIARLILEQYPSKFATEKDAVDRVGAAAAVFSQ